MDHLFEEAATLRAAKRARMRQPQQFAPELQSPVCKPACGTDEFVVDAA